MKAANALFLPNEEATLAFGRQLAKACQGMNLITLSGELGSGKTTLCRGLLRGLGHEGKVKSPTFTLIEPYEINGLRLAHFDLYRLEDPEELEFLGFRDYFEADALCLMEWPEKAGQLLPSADLAFSLQLQGQGRRLSWQAGTEKGKRAGAKLRRFDPP